MSPFLLAILELIFGFVVVGACVLVWCSIYDWFAEHRKLTNQIPRSSVSWNDEHEFLDTIEEFRSDFI